MYRTQDLPRRTLGLPAALRRRIGTYIESSFEITDDILREYRDDVFSQGRFRPTGAEVRIDLDTGKYYVALTGPWYDSCRTLPGGGRKVFTGDHFLDADEHSGLVVDAVNACLTEHGKVAA